MHRLVPVPLLLLLLPALICRPNRVDSLPLSTWGRWIVDAATGQRVKLHCANWPGHMPAVIPEGLNQRPVDVIASKVAALGFNCVRLTWSVHMVRNPEYQNLTVAQSLRNLDLTDAVAGVTKNNPSILDRKVIEAFDATVDALDKAGVMVILDNHVSKPMWCCDRNDGNGFFGDSLFDPEEWKAALQAMATRYRGKQAVVGMSLRNELRGKDSWIDEWYVHMAGGAEAVHGANPDVLVIVSGLNFDSDLSFLRSRPFPMQNNKVVFEAHWYAFSEGKSGDFERKNPSWYCPGVTGRFDYRIGYVMHRENWTAPLFVSEFGYDQRGTDPAGNKFLPCFFAFAVDRDIDWTIWALQGSYYWRDGKAGYEETYGVLDSNWDGTRDPNFQEKFRLLQEKLMDIPLSKTPSYQIIYHLPSGKCLWGDGKSGSNVQLQDCKGRTRWGHDGDVNPIKVAGTSLCLKAQGIGLPITLTDKCNDGSTMWKAAGDANLQMSVIDGTGKLMCMDWSDTSSSTVVTRECRCLQGETCAQDPQPQWFKVVYSNVA